MTRAFCVLWHSCLLLCLLLPGAQGRTPPPIHFTVSALPSPARPGEVVTVTVRAQVDPGWHVYSVVPTPDGPSATAITAFGNWTPLGATTEDAPTRRLDPNFGAVVGFHEGAATFTRAFRAPPGVSSAARLPTVTLHYQTCNASICLPPTDATLPVGKAPPAPNHGGARVSSPSSSPIIGGQGAALGTGIGLSGSLPLFLLAAVGAGLLAILTPCVFPLIPITLTNFVKQADGSQAKLVRLSGGYALGIVALYVALGATVAATLGAAGANKIAANPYVNLTEFALFVLFALSFFEAVQLQLPGSVGALQQSARQHGGTAGLALLGVTFVLGSFTCTAPFVGTLLVTAAGGSFARPLLGMLTFALAFVSPFFVFAAFPQWIARLPKSGLWLARVKATLGFVELAAALKFLSNADQVWQWKLLTQPVLLAAWAMIFLLAALYLVGLLRFGIVAETEAANAPVPPVRRVVAGVFGLCALYCFWGLAGRPLSPYVGAFLPPPGYGSASADAGVLPWLTDYQSALAQARAEGKPLLIDFTGYTCTNCRLNEKNIFPHASVQAELAKFVRVQLYTDGGPNGPANQKLEEQKFGDVALPLYGIVDPQTGAVVDKTAGVQTEAGFTQFLAQATLAPILGSREGEKGLETSSPQTWGAGGASAPWAAYSPDSVRQAVQQGKPVVIDFTAKWCVNCKAIEREVFQDPAVRPALAQNFVTLRADLTQWNSPASVALQKQYGFVSLPTVIFLDRAGRERRDLRITGLLPIADFQKRMAAAQASAGAHA